MDILAANARVLISYHWLLDRPNFESSTSRRCINKFTWVVGAGTGTRTRQSGYVKSRSFPTKLYPFFHLVSEGIRWLGSGLFEDYISVWNAYQRLERLTPKTLYRQTSFLEAIKTNPNYANHVQAIDWSFVNLCFDIQGLGQKPEWPSRSTTPNYAYYRRPGPFQLLSLLTNVTRVGITEEYVGGDIRITIPDSLTLFPRGTCFRILSCLFQKLVKILDL